MINVRGLSKAEVFMALFNGAQPKGVGLLDFNAMPMTEREAQNILDDNRSRGLYFDYVYGRVMKVDLSSDTEFDERLYDRDNGRGAAALAIGRLRKDKAAELNSLSVEELIYSFAVEHGGKLEISAETEENIGKVLRVVARRGDTGAKVAMLAHGRYLDEREVETFCRCIRKAVRDAAFTRQLVMPQKGASEDE